MDDKVSVRLEHLTKRILGRTIVEGVSLEIKRGEVFGLLGPNGAGKTTVMRMMVGLVRPSAGTITVHEKCLKGTNAQNQNDVGSIIEMPQFYGYLTGWQNLEQVSRMVGGIPNSVIHQVVGQTGLSESIHQKVRTYSLGMKQRLGLAQALLNRPAVIIFDEPTNGLDPQGIRDFRAYFRKLAREEGKTVIVSSHLLSEMELMCDRVAILNKGKLVKTVTVGHDNAVDAQEFRLVVAPQTVAMYVLADKFPLSLATQSDDCVIVKIKARDIPLLIEELVHARVSVHEVQPVIRSLEDSYFDWVGRGTDAKTGNQ